MDETSVRSGDVRVSSREENPLYEPAFANHSDEVLHKAKATASPEQRQRIDFELAHRRIRRRAELGAV